MNLEELQPKNEDTFDLAELLEETSQEVLRNRKTELSNKISKLFHKIDALASQQRKEKQALKRTTDRLDKTLALASKLKSGDWSAISQLDNIEDEQKG